MAAGSAHALLLLAVLSWTAGLAAGTSCAAGTSLHSSSTSVCLKDCDSGWTATHHSVACSVCTDNLGFIRECECDTWAGCDAGGDVEHLRYYFNATEKDDVVYDNATTVAEVMETAYLDYMAWRDGRREDWEAEEDPGLRLGESLDGAIAAKGGAERVRGGKRGARARRKANGVRLSESLLSDRGDRNPTKAPTKAPTSASKPTRCTSAPGADSSVLYTLRNHTNLNNCSLTGTDKTPSNGAAGDCGDSLMIGRVCSPTCNSGYSLAGYYDESYSYAETSYPEVEHYTVNNIERDNPNPARPGATHGPMDQVQKSADSSTGINKHCTPSATTCCSGNKPGDDDHECYFSSVGDDRNCGGASSGSYAARRRFCELKNCQAEFTADPPPAKIDSNGQVQAGIASSDYTYCDSQKKVRAARCLKECADFWPTPTNHEDALSTTAAVQDMKDFVKAELQASFQSTINSKCASNTVGSSTQDFDMHDISDLADGTNGMAHMARRRVALNTANICSSRRRAIASGDTQGTTANYMAPLAKVYLIQLGCCFATKVWIKVTKVNSAHQTGSGLKVKGWTAVGDVNEADYACEQFAGSSQGSTTYQGLSSSAFKCSLYHSFRGMSGNPCNFKAVMFAGGSDCAKGPQSTIADYSDDLNFDPADSSTWDQCVKSYVEHAESHYEGFVSQAAEGRKLCKYYKTAQCSPDDGLATLINFGKENPCNIAREDIEAAVRKGISKYRFKLAKEITNAMSTKAPTAASTKSPTKSPTKAPTDAPTTGRRRKSSTNGGGGGAAGRL